MIGIKDGIWQRVKLDNGIEHDTREHIALIVEKSVYGGVIVNYLCQQGNIK